MVLSSDQEFTIRPPAGTKLTLNLHGSSFNLPVVGGPSAFIAATS
jgi:hypothetical protein